MTFSKGYLVIVFLTLITILVWIFSLFYLRSIAAAIPSVKTEQLEPINPTFDIKTVDKLKETENLN